MSPRQCPYCGKFCADELTQCPHCREYLPEPRVSFRQVYTGTEGRVEIRRGLLYMLLAGVLYYFAAGYSPLEFPVAISKVATDWALPLLFLAGFGLLVFGVYRRFSG